MQDIADLEIVNIPSSSEDCWVHTIVATSSTISEYEQVVLDSVSWRLV